MKPAVCCLLFFCLVIMSCDRIKRKGSHVYQSAKKTIKEKRDNLGDKIIRRYDADVPDTRFNKQRFSEFFGFYPTADVKNIYCYSDQMGIDASFWFAFECNDTTFKKIKQNLQLQEPDTSRILPGGSDGREVSMPWWDTAYINKNHSYDAQRGDLYWYLWYDRKKGKVYLYTFDT